MSAPEIDLDTTVPDWVTADPDRRERLERTDDCQGWGWVREFWVESQTERDLSTFYTNSDDVTHGAREALNVPHPEETAGTVVVFLGLDQDHHEVHAEAYDYLGNLGAIRQAITELQRVEARLAQFESLT